MASTAALFTCSDAKPSIVLDTYWRFAAERQAIFFKRFHQQAPPWTSDSILAKHKFTNAYRAADRVSQYLIRNVIYRQDRDHSLTETFFRILVFKLFNQISTWELLESELGGVQFTEFSVDAYDRVLQRAKDRNQRIYSAAYIMPSGKGTFGSPYKHKNHLMLIERMMRDGAAKRIADAPSMQAVYEILLSYPTIGPFLAYQYATDINYSPITNFDEVSFVVPGPGARDGIRKCFSDLGTLNEVDIIKMVQEGQDDAFAQLGLEFQTLWGRPLQLIDCQNLFCEISKYARVAHPEVTGISGRTRIKQQFNPNQESITYFFPPKWGINERIVVDRDGHRTISDSSARVSEPWAEQLTFGFI
jgi:hypothetical protein